MPIARPIGGQAASLAPFLLFLLLWINGCQSPAPPSPGTIDFRHRLDDHGAGWFSFAPPPASILLAQGASRSQGPSG
jgi:hypothetical protein